MLMAFKGWFIGMQDTRSPMAVDILVNVVNMAASYILAFYTSQGILGVAWGTVIAQMSGFLLAEAIMIVRYPDARAYQTLEEWRAIMRWPELRRMMKLNGNLFIRSLCFMVVYVGFSMLASRYGDVELAVSSILMKLFMFFSFFVDGFAYAGEALVGKALGEVQGDKVQSTKGISIIVKTLFNWSIGVGVLFTLIYAVAGDESIAVMTNDVPVLEAAQKYMGWLIAMPIMSAIAFMWDGVYVGATAGP